MFSTICPLLEKQTCCLRKNSQSSFKDLKIFFDSFCLDLQLETFPVKGFRKKAKLAIRGTKENPQIGIFKEKSHEVVDLADCILHDFSIEQVIRVVKEGIKTLKIEPYDEIRHQGVLRYLQVIVNEIGQLQIVFVVTQENASLKQLVEYVMSKTNVVSFWYNLQPLVSNTIFGKQWIHVAKEPFIKIKIKDKTFCFHPGTFCQSNLFAFQKIIDDLSEMLPSMKKGLDLYSGLGLFGLMLSEKFQDLCFAETNPYSHISYLETLKSFPRKHFEFHVGEAKNYLKHHLDADCVIVDPPRKGLEKEIKPLLGQMKKDSYLVYVSCGYQSFMRDVRELIKLGFKIEKAKAYDLFPGSHELEILCMLKKLS